MTALSDQEWQARLSRCKTAADVEELHEGRLMNERHAVMLYPVKHRQMAAQRRLELR